MQAEIETLLILQDRDQKISDFRKQLARVPEDELSAKARLKGDTEDLEKCRLAGQQNEVEMKNLELDIDTRKQSIERLKVQQFETKKNEEFRAMGCEIERYGEEVTSLEDRELEFMELGEKLRAQTAEATSALAATQVLVDEELLDLVSRAENLKKDLETLAVERVGIVEKLEADTVEIFDRLMKNKQGVSVVALKQGQCTGCHVRVISDTVLQAKSGKSLTHCENCGRIVYCVE